MQVNPLIFSSPHIIRKAESTERQDQDDFSEVLAKAKREQEDAQLKKACQDLEALFIQQMLKRMRATIPKSGFIPESMATKMYEEMLDAEYSKTIAESPHHFGLADLLYEQLKPTIKGPNLE